MEIVCAPETYRRFESSSLRQTKRVGNAPILFVIKFGSTSNIVILAVIPTERSERSVSPKRILPFLRGDSYGALFL